MKIAYWMSLAVALTGVGIFCAEESLGEAHLAQARMVTVENKPTQVSEFQKLHHELDARIKEWKTKLDDRPGEAELLAGISPAALKQARDISEKPEQIKETLRKPVSLQKLLALVAVRNPDARSNYQNWRAMTKQFEQASYLEDLLSRYRSFVRELDTGVGPQTHKEMPSATFPFPSSLALKGQMIDIESEIGRLGYLQALKTALTLTANEFFEVQAMGVELGLMKKSRELYEQIVKSTKAQLENGKMTQADLLKAQSQLANLDDQLNILYHHRLHHVAQINVLMGLPAHTEWGEIVETDLTARTETQQQLLEIERRENQEILKANRQIELQEITVRMAEAMVYPRASAGMSQLALSQGAEAGPTRSEMAAFPERPEVNTDRADFGANAAYIDELRVRIREAREMAGSMIAKVDWMLDHGRFSYHIAERNRNTYATVVIPKSQQSYELVKKHFAVGDAALTELLEAGRMYFDNEKMLNDYRRDRNKALVDLQDALGRNAAALLPPAPPPPATAKEHVHD